MCVRVHVKTLCRLAFQTPDLTFPTFHPSSGSGGGVDTGKCVGAGTGTGLSISKGAFSGKVKDEVQVEV